MARNSPRLSKNRHTISSIFLVLFNTVFGIIYGVDLRAEMLFNDAFADENLSERGDDDLGENCLRPCYVLSINFNAA